MVSDERRECSLGSRTTGDEHTVHECGAVARVLGDATAPDGPKLASSRDVMQDTVDANAPTTMKRSVRSSDTGLGTAGGPTTSESDDEH